MHIEIAEQVDLEEILALQYLAYQSEARLLNNPSIPPLTQTLDEVKEEYRDGTFLKALDNCGTIIGSVRGYVDGDTLFISKFIVRPDMQGQGIGTQLLARIERLFPNHRYELFTSDKSERNIRLYQRLGYTIFKERDVSGDLKFIYLEKRPDQPVQSSS